MSDLYAVLGVPAMAEPDEVKKAYRRLARRYHPDKNPGNADAERIFKDAAEAYRVLGDADLRAQYDRLGAAGRGSSPADRGNKAGAEAADVFNEIFGARSRASRGRGRAGGGRRPVAERGEDLRYTLDLNFEDAALGCERQISVPRHVRCSTCAGTGARAGTAPIICKACSGTGTSRDEKGVFSMGRSCSPCNGTGKLIPDPCPVCRGKARTRKSHTLRVTVPADVVAGTRLRLAGEGEAGTGDGPRGDLFVVLQVKPHPFFEREDDVLVAEVPVRIDQAALGATIEVPTLDGKVRMRIPPGSQSGRVFRLKGKGVPGVNGRPRGDQRVRIVVEIPEHLSDEQRGLLERFADLEGVHAANPIVRDFVRRMADYYDGGQGGVG